MMADPRELPGSDGYLEALASYLRQPGLCWHAWVVLYPDGSYYVPDGNVAYSPMPWEPEGAAWCCTGRRRSEGYGCRSSGGRSWMGG